VADRVLLSADRNNIEDCIELAKEADLGIEVMAFAYPDVLDGPWETTLVTYQRLLRDVPGMITVHGPFMDMVSGSPDGRINQVCLQRYQHAINITAELGSKLVIFHANFIGTLHNVPYRKGWHTRNVPFWAQLATYAAEHGVTIALENMWEFEPGIIADVLRDVNHPNLRACLDVGHAHVFSDENYTLDDWLKALQPWLIHSHMNNNNGIIDEHYGFAWSEGVLDYHSILPKIRALPNPPSIVLEMYHVKDMRDSLRWMAVGERRKTPA
jgi:sugar phosphate isomerase/epimerase